LREGEDVILPDYDYKTCKRKEPGILRKWAPLIIFEGIFALLDREINLKFLDFKIFVHTDDDLRLARRIQRDIVERGRKIDGVLKSYHKFVKPAHSEFVKPTMKFADLIVPRGRAIEHERNMIAIDFIVNNLEHQLMERGFEIGSDI
jgi:uridine kinase